MKNRNAVPQTEIRNQILAAVGLTVGTALTALAFAWFVLPQGFTAAGVTGFSSVVIELLPVALPVMVLFVNILFLLMGLLFEGMAFALKTVAVSLLFPILLQVFMTNTPSLPGNGWSILAAGLLLGSGTAILLESGASSGGFAVAAVILKNRFHIPAAIVLNLCDAVIILLQAIHCSFAQVVCGILVITISAAVVGLSEAARQNTEAGLLRNLQNPIRCGGVKNMNRQAVPGEMRKTPRSF